MNNLLDNNNASNNSIDNGGANSWDSGYPSGGNYWSDYADIDVRNGWDQYQEGSEGIGDTPYNVSSETGAYDRFSLISPYIFRDIVQRYMDSDGIVRRSGALQAAMDFFAGTISKYDVMQVLVAYFNG